MVENGFIEVEMLTSDICECSLRWPSRTSFQFLICGLRYFMLPRMDPYFRLSWMIAWKNFNANLKTSTHLKLANEFDVIFFIWKTLLRRAPIFYLRDFGMNFILNFATDVSNATRLHFRFLQKSFGISHKFPGDCQRRNYKGWCCEYPLPIQMWFYYRYIPTLHLLRIFSIVALIFGKGVAPFILVQSRMEKFEPIPIVTLSIKIVILLMKIVILLMKIFIWWFDQIIAWFEKGIKSNQVLKFLRSNQGRQNAASNQVTIWFLPTPGGKLCKGKKLIDWCCLVHSVNPPKYRFIIMILARGISKGNLSPRALWKYEMPRPKCIFWMFAEMHFDNIEIVFPVVKALWASL